ncbi:MAG: FAD-dependent oxidoreductase [Patescibacteria group bacterium]
MAESKTRALIVGGGFGGVKAALELAKDEHFDVTLLSNRTDFQYFPTLYRTATGGKMSQSCIPLASLFEGKPVRLVQGSAKRLNRKKKVVKTSEGKEYGYDVLVLALGSVPNYFGIKGIDTYAYSIKTPEEARRFKNHLHQQLADGRQPDLNYVIVGGGPTGIELAGALPGYLKAVMQAHGIKRRAVHIDLVEAAPKLVPRMPKRMSRIIARRLRHLGVKLYLGQTVQGETADMLMVNDKPIQSHTVVWTAGVTNHPFFKENEFALNERGKVLVDEYLQADTDIYVLGDNADTSFSGMAQTALYDAIFVGENLTRQRAGKLMRRYTPKEPIYVIPAGEHWAAVLWGKRQIYGFPAWILRTLADLVAYKDYQPWWKAGRQWMTEFETEEDCPTCKECLR